MEKVVEPESTDNFKNLMYKNYELKINKFGLDKFKDNTDHEILEKIIYHREKLNQKVGNKNSIFKNNIIKTLVSREKIRFDYDDFDLDLTYITDRIIAMGYPAEDIEKLFRNSLEEVKEFFLKRHDKRYKIYNLCSERAYANDTFQNQAHYRFKDHEAPPFNLIFEFCKDMDNWLNENPENVSAIHCKAGKGRTGVMICCYLIYSNFVSGWKQALKYYGIMRTYDGKGVTIKSQIRYIQFFEQIIKHNIPHPINSPRVLLKKIIFSSVPNFNLISDGCKPYFDIQNGNFLYSYKKENQDKIRNYYLGDKVNIHSINTYLQGDFLMIFYNDGIFGKKKMFKFWYNTYFIPQDRIISIKKYRLDMKVNKENDSFSDDFKITLFFHF